MILPLCSALVRHLSPFPRSLHPVLGSLYQADTGVQQRAAKVMSTGYTKEVWEGWGCSACRREGSGSLSCVGLNTQRREQRQHLLTEVPSETKGNGHKFKFRKFCLDAREYFLLSRWSNIETCYPERLWSLCPWRYLKPNWTQLWAIIYSWPCLSRGLDLSIFGSPLQSWWFCHSMKHREMYSTHK